MVRNRVNEHSCRAVVHTSEDPSNSMMEVANLSSDVPRGKPCAVLNAEARSAGTFPMLVHVPNEENISVGGSILLKASME